MTLDFTQLVTDLRHDGTGERQYMREARSDLSDKLQNAADAIEQLQAEVARLSHALAAETAKREAMEAALRYYNDQFCEGFCDDMPEAGTYHISMDDRCSGCKARATLAKHGSK